MRVAASVADTRAEHDCSEDWSDQQDRANKRIQVHEGVRVSAVQGERRPERVTRTVFNHDSDTDKSAGPTQQFRVSAVFVFIGAEPVGSVRGILAAGDIRSASSKRVGFAAGDGTPAVTCVHKLIKIRN
jgi:thioredoxin reductase